MKKITKLLGIFALTVCLGASSPVIAQTTENGTSTTQSADDDGDDDNGKWGLAGLLGLLGLLGLKKKDRDDHKITTTTNR